jgi:predicted nucleic acid-binding protein
MIVVSDTSPITTLLQIGNIATREGLRFIGLVSVLVESKLEGFIPSLRDVLREIETETTFFISLEIKNLALKRAGEL